MTKMIEVTQEDGNNYCRVLTALGMEEEGDPVEAIERLRDLAASEGTRAVTYLRRARKAEAALRGMVDLADRIDLDRPTFGECKALRNARAALVEEPTSDA